MKPINRSRAADCAYDTVSSVSAQSILPDKTEFFAAVAERLARGTIEKPKYTISTTRSRVRTKTCVF